MRLTDHFSLYVVPPVVVLRCDFCHARDWGMGDVFAWNTSEDMNLSGVISRAQTHWSLIHEEDTYQ